MKDVFIKTRNYNKLSEAMSRLQLLPKKTDKMGIAYGNPGLGKTVGLEELASEHNAIIIRANETWTVSSFLKELAYELGLDESGRSSALFKRITGALSSEPRIIIIDEIDKLLERNNRVFELLRDIHDTSKNIIFFIGMESSLAKIKRHRHYFSRLTEIVKLDPISKEDITKLCTLCEVKIEADLIEYFSVKYPNLRDIIALLRRIEAEADKNDIESFNLQLAKQTKVVK